jgi:predicted metal-dependent hydrolase
MAIMHFGEKYLETTVPPGDSRLVWIEENCIYISSFTESKTEVSRILKRWKEREAKSYLVARVRILSEKTGLIAKKISFRYQKSRWGSCNEHGDLSLNIRLIELPISLIDYVLIHELVHTVHLNHSKKFWNLVNHFCPGARSIDRALKQWV